MSPAYPITICSVSFNSRPWLEANLELARRLNVGGELTWLVSENSPAGSNLSLSQSDRRFSVVPGPAFERRVYASGSYHHGRGINLLLPHIRTRFVLFCDPDFFIVKVGWASEAVRHMLVRGLAVFGAPWHPRWVYKNRYFPCVHCMFVDLDRVPVASLDFEPDYEGVPGHARDPDASDRSAPGLRLPDPLKLRKRLHVGTSRDVSSRIAARLGADPTLRIECLQPVFRPPDFGLARFVDLVVPDTLSLTPKRRHYFSRSGFKDHGLPDLDGRGWEEFLWRDEPFGFHIRSQPKLKHEGSLDKHLAEVNGVLRAFLG